MNKGARVFTCYWGDVLVAMFSVLNQPSGSYKYAYRVHRVVVLPDYQGLGIGTKLFDFFGEYFISNGDKLFLRSSHVRLANHCRDSSKWLEGSSSCKISNAGGASHEKKYKNYDRKRVPYSFEYVGENYNSKEHQLIICLGETNEETAKEYLNKIVDENKNPIIISGVADIKYQTVWEKVAKEKGIRTELLYIKSHNKYTMVQKYLKQKVDGIIIGKEAQAQISQFKHSKDFRQLITFNYKHGDPIYKERLLPKEN